MSKKPTVAYLTRHTVSNYGSVLQAFATQTALEKLGYDPVCINYYRSDEKPKELVHTLLQCSKWNKNALTRLVYMLTQKPVYSYAGKKFEQYRKIVKLTKEEYNSEQDLILNCPQAEIYMTGSDQVWNTITLNKIDPVYFMSFLNNEQKRIAYAASFGSSSVKDEDKPVMSKLLKKYDFISVRENSGVKIAEELGVNRCLTQLFFSQRRSGKKLLRSVSAEKNMCLFISFTRTKALTNTQRNLQRRKV